MIMYVQSHPNFEKPTARLYYTKMLEELKIDARWNLARSKMRHLKALHVKANEFLQSTAPGVENVQEKVNKICPHYKLLTDIFNNTKKVAVREYDTMIPSDMFDLDVDSAGQLSSDQDVTSVDECEQPKFKKCRVHTSMERLCSSEDMRLTLRREYLALEEKKHEQLLHLEHEKLKLEHKRINLEEEIIKNDFAFKKLQLEKEERMQILELELKYKNACEEITKEEPLFTE